MNILVSGCADVGLRIARLHSEQGDHVSALTRSEKRASTLQDAGLDVLRHDLDQPLSTADVPQFDLVYMLAPPGGDGSHDPRLEHLLDWLTPNPPARFVYISTTGVYGDCASAWVDETWPRNPQTDRARRRAAAEQKLELWSQNSACNHCIVRVAGIYGPDRLPVARLQRREPVLTEADSPWSNRIHSDDLARAAWLVATAPTAHGIYNACDDVPSTMTDYFNQVADVLGLPRPPQVSRAEADKTFSPAMLSFLNESRRISNRRLRHELGLTLRYPDLATGLPACRDLTNTSITD
ncbi:MAG: SDR family oxidoreductase [Gammaproteobacteria bacterium]